LIEVKNIYKSFGNKSVLSGIDLTISKGDTYCIIGKSGSGKSVLLKIIVGILSADKGEIIFDDLNIGSLSKSESFEMRKKLGFVFQGAALFDSMTVFENTIISMYEHGERDLLKLELEAKRVLSAVSLLPDISEIRSDNYENEWKILKDKKPSDLSGGMRKRVGVARALVGSPEYIFYDEPTTGLDPVTSEQIDDMIASLANTLNVTSIVITHDMFSVYRIADKISMLHDGKVYFNGTVDEMRNSDDRIVHEFIDRFNK